MAALSRDAAEMAAANVNQVRPKFEIGERVRWINDYGVKFKNTIIGIIWNHDKAEYEYRLNTSGYWCHHEERRLKKDKTNDR